MSHRLLRSTTLYEFLFSCDHDLAERTRRAGCPRCGGVLHRGNYQRKPRGGPPIPERLRSDPDALRRLSFNCAKCRRRRMPPSVRFLGRRVYLAATVILLCAFAHGMTPRRVRQLRVLYDVSRETLLRWQAWWRETFVLTETWRTLRGQLMPPVEESELPRSLLKRFGPVGTRRGLMAVLRLLARGTGELSEGGSGTRRG